MADTTLAVASEPHLRRPTRSVALPALIFAAFALVPLLAALTAEQYLQRWGLPADHPLTAPMYSQQRSVLARELGLGRGGRSA